MKDLFTVMSTQWYKCKLPPVVYFYQLFLSLILLKLNAILTAASTHR